MRFSPEENMFRVQIDIPYRKPVINMEREPLSWDYWDLRGLLRLP